MKNRKFYIKNKISNKEFNENKRRKRKLDFLSHKERVKFKKEMKETKRTIRKIKWEGKKLKRMIKSTRHIMQEISKIPEETWKKLVSKLCGENGENNGHNN